MLSVTLICCIASSFKDFKCRHQHFKIVIIKKKQMRILEKYVCHESVKRQEVQVGKNQQL